jgi:hypothetical protein
MAVLMRLGAGKGHGLFVAIAACFLVYAVPCARAQPASAPEYEVKAAFIYNFAKFVEWPEGAFSSGNAAINLCVTDEGPSMKAFESVRGKTVKGREIVVGQCDEIQDIAACHILFVSSSGKKRPGQVLEAVKGRRILTVGDEKGFARLGGIINFITVDNKISFEINPDAAKRAGLEISSKLLKLAEIVREEP